MRFVQPLLNSCFTQTHTQHNTYPSRLAEGPDQKLAQSHTATPCSNCHLSRASPISARVDLSPSTQLVGPIMKATKISQKKTQRRELSKNPRKRWTLILTSALARSRRGRILNWGVQKLVPFKISPFIAVLPLN